MLQRGLDSILLWEIGMLRVVDGRLTGLVPQQKDAPHGGIHLAAAVRIQVPAQEQQVQDPRIHRHRGDPRLVIDGLEVVDPLIVVVNVVELVVFQQQIVSHLRRLCKDLLALRIAHDRGHCIEHVQKGRLILLGPRLHLLRSGAGGQKEAGEQQGQQPEPHRSFSSRAWKPPMEMVTLEARSASAGLVASSTAMPATSSRVLPVT